MLANAFFQLPVAYMTHRIRQQAGSYSLVSRRIIYIGGKFECGTAYPVMDEGGLSGLLVLAQLSYAATSYSFSTSTSPLTSA